MSISNLLVPNNLNLFFNNLSPNEIDTPIGNITTLNTTVGNITTLNTTNSYVTTGNVTTLNSITGNVTTLNTFGIIVPTKNSITQQTSITTAVAISGRIFSVTTVSATIAAGASASFTINNGGILADDYLFTTLSYTGTGNPVISAPISSAGSVVVTIYNRHPTAALNDVLKIFCLLL